MARGVLVLQSRGGYKRIPLGEMKREEYTRGRKVLWGKRHRIWIPRTTMWRLTLGINYTWARKYYSFTYQKWYDHEPTDAEVEQARREFLTDFKAGTLVKYDPVDWWFGDEEDVNLEIVEVPWGSKLVGSSESYDKVSGKESFNVAAMARKMVKDGRWFRQATLDKWAWALEASADEE